VSYGDVLFSMIGTVGETCVVKNKVIDFAIKNIGLFKSKSFDDGEWLYYFLKSNQSKQYLEAHLTGATQQYLTLENLRKYPVIVPPTKERTQITEILSSLDDKIELNRKMNETLEKIGQILFKH
jgi:type I restriction enzyme S subunit